MLAPPEVRYATTEDGASIAFQVVGSGPPDVLYAPGIPTQLNALWDLPVFFYAQFLERLASFSRLLVFDARGSGLSDPLPGDQLLSLEAQAGELLAVLDAAGIGDASVIAEVNAGPAAIRLAAEHPDRVRSLALNMTYARVLGDTGYAGPTAEEYAELCDMLVEGWGSGVSVGLWAAELAADPRMVREMAQFEQVAASPGRLRSLQALWTHNDARADLSRVAVPTLVLHDRDNVFVPTEQGRYLAEHIPGAKFVEYPGPAEISTAEIMLVTVAAVCEFITGSQAPARSDRILGVLLFVDVVGSTEGVVAQGDTEWRSSIEAFRRAAAADLARVGGARLVNTRGDDVFVLCATPGSAISLARSLQVSAKELGFEVRAGIHLAEVDDAGDDLLGLGVHVAARVCAQATAGEIVVSDAVRAALLGGPERFEDHGSHELKGLPDAWQLWRVVEPEGADLKVAP